MAINSSWQKNVTLWEGLHGEPRFLPVYPNEDVVRFLACTYSPMNHRKGHFPRVLDIGVGGGRHTRLLCEMGFDAYGLDISMVGLKHAQASIERRRWKAGLTRASMDLLPFRGESFDAAISFSVFHYGSANEMRSAIRELYRVLKTKGKALVTLRTTNDYRFGKGDPVGPNTFILRIHETNEFGSVQHFLDEKAVFDYFSSFSHISLEKAETTLRGRTAMNSEWLIAVEK